jgi:glycerate kinase
MQAGLAGLGIVLFMLSQAAMNHLNRKRPLRILIVPDKFKGTLSAEAACAAIAAGWRAVRPADDLDCLPMSDGGDGFGDVLARLTEAKTRIVRTVDAAHRPIQANWWWAPGQSLAIVESARVIGLAMLPERQFHPFQLDTFGLGRVLMEAVRLGAKHCLMGIGGSATNDGGFGLARALGWRFLDEQEHELDQWWQLIRLARIVAPAVPLKLRLTVAVDVRNPLLGSRGCSAIYGPQKGLQPGDIGYADKCLRRLSEVWRRSHAVGGAHCSGAGAAGGLGFSMMAFAGAELRDGFEVFAQAAGLGQRICRADLVITGEGAIDRQTYMGKGVGQVGRLGQKLGVPCVALAGIAPRPRGRKLFWQVKALTDITPREMAKRWPARYLQQAAASLASEFR